MATQTGRQDGVCRCVPIITDDRAVRLHINRQRECLPKLPAFFVDDRMGRRANDRVLHVESDIPQGHLWRFIETDAALLQRIRQFKLRVDDLLEVILADAGRIDLPAEEHLPDRVKLLNLIIDHTVHQWQWLASVLEQPGFTVSGFTGGRVRLAVEGRVANELYAIVESPILQYIRACADRMAPEFHAVMFDGFVRDHERVRHCQHPDQLRVWLPQFDLQCITVRCDKAGYLCCWIASRGPLLRACHMIDKDPIAGRFHPRIKRAGERVYEVFRRYLPAFTARA